MATNTDLPLRHPAYCTFAGKTYDETNGAPSDCLCPPGAQDGENLYEDGT